MKDLLKDFLEASRDRIKTPITGSFALAFILWNWRPILILLLSDSSIEDRIKYINKNDCNYWALLAPLLIAFLYIITIPYIMMILERITKKAIERRKGHKSTQSLFDLRIAQKIALEEFKLEEVRSGQRDISELNDRITELNNQINIQNYQHEIQIENYEKLIEGYKKNEDNSKALLEETIEETEVQKEQLLNQVSKYINPDKVAFLFDNEERKKFIDFCDFYIYEKEGSRYEPYHGEKSIPFEEILKDLLLITENNGKYHTTAIGYRLYLYLTQKEV